MINGSAQAIPTTSAEWARPPPHLRPTDAALPTVLLAPGGRWPRIDWRELWAYRGLLLFLVWRDLKVRYAQTVLGIGWAVVQPVLSTVVFTIIFGSFAQVPSDGVPYPLFSLTALVPWTYFAAALAGATNSLVSNTNLLTKVYFPRLVIPFSMVLTGLIDFAIGMMLVFGTMLWYGVVPSLAGLALLPVLVGIMIMTATGVGCWLAALNIQYRDVKYVMPFLIQVWMYASPIVYPMSIVPENLRWLYALNPMAGVIEGFRSVLLGTNAVAWSTISISVATSAVLFVAGLHFFRRMERIFADVA